VAVFLLPLYIFFILFVSRSVFVHFYCLCFRVFLKIAKSGY
jgi:hypothetical protein